MPFHYYARLSAGNKRIYDASERIEALQLSNASELWLPVAELQTALKSDRPAAVQQVCQALADRMCDQLQAPPVTIKVLAKRPSSRYGELHGLYEGVEGALKVAKITLWMRTATRRQVVAFRSFLRTLLHELCHHFDYTHFRLADSFHTAGFYKRESSLFHQLVTDATKADGAELFPASGGETVK
ncbi:MAG: hypothetical protein KGQ68_00760 [Gammaproteobacteria bacterium]|nr:hypothetical protein [Gammaproteobacteria bacterium]MDE2023421.1 hypothetical protein [Gammaproteobacteria bacterium]